MVLFGIWPFGQFLNLWLPCGPFRAIGEIATFAAGSFGMSWGVLQTHLNASAVAVTNLKRQGFEVYNPRVNERVIVQGRIHSWRRAQLFKDYLFVKIESQWRALLSTRGVKQLILWHENQPALIPNKVIKELRDREDPITGLIEVERRAPFVPGQTVQFKPTTVDGAPHPFAWQHAIFDDQSSDERVFVLFTLLGKKNRVQVNKRELIAA